MEPQIIDYYNDEPSNVYVIDKMNKELDEIQKNKANAVQERYNKEQVKYVKKMNQLEEQRKEKKLEIREERYKQL